jgi:hypothetical protein
MEMELLRASVLLRRHHLNWHSSRCSQQMFNAGWTADSFHLTPKAIQIFAFEIKL